MSNFMGPMAPPQAAQPQPQALDFKTDPNQRQQFKNFMRQRMQPPMPRVPAPAPMPQPIPSVPAGSYIFPDMDIFDAQPYAEGGIVGGLNSLGEMSGQMVEALNQVVYGGGQGGGMGSSGAPAAPAAMSSPISSGASSASVVSADAMSSALPPPLPPIQPMAPSQPSSLNPSSVVYNDAMMANQGPIQAPTVPQQNLDASRLNILPVEPEVSNGSIFENATQPMRGVGAYGFEDSAMSQPVDQAVPDLASNMSREMSPDSRYFNVPDTSQMQSLPGIQPSAEVQARLDALGIQRGLGQRGNSMAQRPAGIGGIGRMGGLLMRNEGGPVPPRETDIRGMHHELAYITPDEADILEALGGTGEAGPMGIPAYRPGGDDVGSENAGSGDHSGGEGSASGANSGDDGGNNGPGDNSDDGYDPGDFDVNTNTPKGSEPDDPFAGEEGDDFSVGNYGNDDGSFNADDFADFGVRGQTKDTAIKDAFVTDRFGNPIGTKSGYVTQGRATDAELSAGYKALGLPDPNSDLASADVEASYGVPTNAIDTVFSGVPADPLSSSKKGLLGLNSQDLLAIENFSYAPPAQTNVSLSRNPSSSTGKNSAPIGLQDIQAIDELSFGPPAQSVSFNDPQYGNISQTTDFDLMGSPISSTTTSDLADFSKTETLSSPMSSVSAPSSNVVSDFSPTSADQLDAQYGMPAGYFSGLNDLVDDDFAAIGNRPGDMSSDLASALGVGAPGTGYTDQGLPVGLEFATNPQTGAPITTNLAGLTEQQQKDQPLSMDIAQFIGSNPYGYEIDPATGNPIGQVGTAPFGVLGSLTTLAQDLVMGPPQTTQDLIERGAYTGMTGQNNDDDIFGGDRDVNVLLPLPPEEVVPESTDPNQMGNAAAPTAPTAPGSVLVPSTRTSTPFSGQMPVGYGTPQTGQINPYSLAEMRRYQEMLARLGQPKLPVGFADGGSVLDAAAGKFLESLTAA